MRRVKAAVEASGLRGEVRLDGSVAKDTWLSRQVDLDIFIRLPTDIPKESFGERCIPIAREALRPAKIIERYAEHPYAETYVDNVRVNVVPCYNVARGAWKSATDRTPFHTEYIRSHLTTEQRDQVRLLKAFMTGIGTYGADIKTGGFSGMLCETLTAAKGSFRSALTAAADWKPRTVIDVEAYYRERGEELEDLFGDDLIVIDPVDKGRNLAASVTRRRLWEFVSAARLLLADPSLRYFFPPEPKTPTTARMRKLLSDRHLVAFGVGRIEAVVDILWSQLYRTENALASHLKSNGFEVVRSESWSNEKDLSVILFEVSTEPLGAVYLHRGPEVSRGPEGSRFLEKNLNSNQTASGPWIADDRWMVAKRRRARYAADVLEAVMKSNRNRELGVARRVSEAARRTGNIWSTQEIQRLYARNKQFACFLAEFIEGKPRWLKP